MFKLKRLVPTRQIPGTLNVGHALPTIAQAFIFIAIVEVEMTTLIGMIAAAVAGAWLGAGVVARLAAARASRSGWALALLAAASFFALTNLGLVPGGGDALGARRRRCSWVGVAGNFVLGALMTLGIGLYAPCMILVEPARHEPEGRVPDHDGLVRVPDAGRRPALHRASGSYDLRPRSAWRSAASRPCCSPPTSCKSLPLDVRCAGCVVVVVLYTAVAMLRSARREG